MAHFTIKILCRRQNLEQKLLGKSESGEVLEAGDGEDEQQGPVHLRLVDWEHQLPFGGCKQLGDHPSLRPSGVAVLLRKLSFNVLQPATSFMECMFK